MIRRPFLCFLAFLLLLAGTAWADPLVLTDDLAGSVEYPLGESDSSPVYSYAYAYPQADPADEAAELINAFYAYKVSDALDFEVPMLVDYYSSAETAEDVFVRISYTVTCNSDDYFSVLLKTEGNDYLTYTGHTFSRTDTKPGSSVSLPYLLGILATDESDTWLQDRQTAKADALVRSLVWEMLEDQRDRIGVYEDFDRELFDLLFYPEEDFYLDEKGDPVFYLEPGIAADASADLLRFPVTVWEIMDEM